MPKKKYIQIYLKELSEFTFEDFKEYADGAINDKEITDVLSVLKNKRIIVQCRSKREAEAIRDDFDYGNYDDVEDYSEINPMVRQIFVIKYVGIIIIKNIVLRCFPKYIPNVINGEYEKIDNSLKIIMKVLEKYNQRKKSLKENIYSAGGSDINSSFDYLSLVIYFLNDYLENGIYFNQKNVLTFNGEGNLNWVETVNSLDAIISDGYPVYVDFYTEIAEDDGNDYFRRLHMAILNECAKILESANLFNIFSINGEFLFNIEIEDLGDKEFIIDRIKKEIGVQFITRKLELLEKMFLYIDNSDNLEKEYQFSLYGTSHFHTVWEDVCQDVFTSQLNCKLEELSLNSDLDYEKLIQNEYTKEKIDKYRNEELKKELQRRTVKSMIHRPLWFVQNGKGYHEAEKAYEPDLLQIMLLQQNCSIHISDAKYRDFILNDNTVKNAPGVEEITKQYMYQLSLKNFINAIMLDIKINNTFLFPADNEDLCEISGWVELDCLHDLGLENVKALKLPATKMYTYYIGNHKIMNINEL